jgi:hypothetical protein
MTTPDDSARVTRPEPARTGPIRGVLQPLPEAPAATGPGPAGPVPTGSEPALPPVPSDPVSESVAHAVRVGYDVVAANIKEGRMAAQRFRQGEYNVRDVPRDLNAMTMRLVHLARDLSATTFDVVEQLLKDPNLPGAAAETRRESAPSLRPVAPVAPPFHPTPAHPAAGHPRNHEPALVPLTCVFTGSRPAVLKAARVSRPDRPTHPEQLSTTPLTSTAPGARPIGGITFAAAAGGAGLIAQAPIPDDQAAGVYSGLIYAPSADTPLGFITIEVLAEGAG